jgi:hypothetical protein
MDRQLADLIEPITLHEIGIAVVERDERDSGKRREPSPDFGIEAFEPIDRLGGVGAIAPRILRV